MTTTSHELYNSKLLAQLHDTRVLIAARRGVRKLLTALVFLFVCMIWCSLMVYNNEHIMPLVALFCVCVSMNSANTKSLRQLETRMTTLRDQHIEHAFKTQRNTGVQFNRTSYSGSD